MKLLKPERLRLGDTVGIVAPASPPPDPKAVDRAVESAERYGFKPKLGKFAHERHGFLAGNDRDRAVDIPTSMAWVVTLSRCDNIRLISWNSTRMSCARRGTFRRNSFSIARQKACSCVIGAT